MYWIKTKCYLCGKEAEKLSSYQNVRVRCENCGTYYTFSSLIPLARLDKDTNELLYRDFKTGEKHHIHSTKKLLDYIKKRTDDTGRFPFLITPQILDDLYNK
ncbi:MAG: hypothetical protein PVH84_13995 [Candidatus Aminicenantes bacterium]